MKREHKDILSVKCIDTIKTYLTFETIECLEQLELNRIKNRFLGHLSETHTLDLEGFNLIDGMLRNISPCIKICEEVYADARERYNKKINKNRVSLMVREDRPRRGGYNILDDYIFDAWNTGLLSEYDLKEVFCMYLVHVMLNYDDENTMNYAVSYVSGHLTERNLLRQAKNSFETRDDRTVYED